MSIIPLRRQRPALRIAMSLALFVTVIAAISAHGAVAEVAGGLVLVSVSVLWATTLARRLLAETDPGRVLGLDFLVSLAVVLGLVGVGVMALAMPA